MKTTSHTWAALGNPGPGQASLHRGRLRCRYIYSGPLAEAMDWWRRLTPEHQAVLALSGVLILLTVFSCFYLYKVIKATSGEEKAAPQVVRNCRATCQS